MLVLFFFFFFTSMLMEEVKVLFQLYLKTSWEEF